MAKTKADAREHCKNNGVIMGKDFHTLDNDQVERITSAADAHGYRKPKNANGSRARYFYAYVNR